VDAFPTIQKDADFLALLDRFGLKVSDRVEKLAALEEQTVSFFEALAKVIIEVQPRKPLSKVAPGLMLQTQPIPFPNLSTRPASALLRGRVTIFRELGRWTSAALMKQHGLGRKSVNEIVALALQGAVMGCANSGKRADESVRPPAPEVASNILSSALPAVSLIARWALCVGDAKSLGDALGRAGQRTVPDDVAAEIAELLTTELQSITGMSRNEAFARSFAALLARCRSERSVDILRQRLPLDCSTLEEVGAKLGITRERVRQLQEGAEQRLLEAISALECSEVRWRVEEVRRCLGRSIRLDSPVALAVLERARDGLPEEQNGFAGALLLWLAGPYTLDRGTGWIHASKASELGPPPLASLFDAFVDADGLVDIEGLRARAAAAGMVESAISEWLSGHCPLRMIDGKTYLWRGTVTDKAATILSALNKPSTAEELNTFIGEDHSVRGLRSRLLEDERFVRTDLVRVGLRKWGLEEYSGIAEEIEEEIKSQGGDADLEELIRAVSDRFGVRESSVSSYTMAPRFVIDGSRIRVRRSEESFVPRRTLVDEPRAYFLDDSRVSFRFGIDNEVLRGSGQPLPQGVGAWLGVLPGGRRLFRFANKETALVSWPESALMGPSLGSVRRSVEVMGGQLGDQALLTMNRSDGSADVAVLKPMQIEASEGWQRVMLLTGIRAANSSECERWLALAVGARDTNELRARLRRRGERDLCDLLETRNSPDLTDALERLKGVL